MFLFVVFVFVSVNLLFKDNKYASITFYLLFFVLFIFLCQPIDTKRKELKFRGMFTVYFNFLPEDYPVFLVQLTQSNLFQIYKGSDLFRGPENILLWSNRYLNLFFFWFTFFFFFFFEFGLICVIRNFFFFPPFA